MHLPVCLCSLVVALLSSSEPPLALIGSISITTISFLMLLLLELDHHHHHRLLPSLAFRSFTSPAHQSSTYFV